MKKVFVFCMMVIFALFSLTGCASSSKEQGNTSTSKEEATKLRLSASLAQVHFWVKGYMDPFAERIETEASGKVKFDRYYAGELVKVGRELDALKGGTIDVACPFLAPYHEGLFPLSDVTQLPLINTDSGITTRALQKLVDSDVVLKDGKTFYDYEIKSKGLKAWPLATTEKYVLSTTGKEFPTADSFKGVPIRAGSNLHMMLLEALGCTPVYMPAAEAYEALSKGTINGLILSVADWKSYGMQEIAKYTITGINFGHWDSYLAMKEETWNKLPKDVQELWDKAAREQTMKNAEYMMNLDKEQIKESKEKGFKFVDVSELDPSVKEKLSKAASATWEKWITQVEKEGHPAKETAKLWAKLIMEEGGQLPDGVDKILGI